MTRVTCRSILNMHVVHTAQAYALLLDTHSSYSRISGQDCEGSGDDLLPTADFRVPYDAYHACCNKRTPLVSDMWCVLQWCRAVSKIRLLERDDPVYEWRERIFKEFHSTISSSFGYPV